MPQIKSAKKRMKTSAKSHTRNKAVKSELTTMRRKLYETIAAGDKATAEKIYRTYNSAVDKAVKKGIIKANAGARRKSRASARLV